jgi:CubicO group peptidase (beta-lactamase class C family)
VEKELPHRIAGFGPRSGAAGPIRADTAPSRDAEMVLRVQEFVARLADAEAFSGVVLLARDGEPLLFEAHGPADRNFDVPIRKDTRFNIGSMNKTFTAAVIGQLVEEGLLHWDDPLSHFLPDFPDPESAHRVQLRHLLSHTSGLGSYFNARFREGSRLQWRTVDDYMELARPDSLRFEPGTRYAYSNTGFLVLGKVIEVVTGQPWEVVIEERIHRRAGMTGSGTFDVDLVVPNLAVSYTRVATEHGLTWRNTLYEHVIRGGPAGGGFATAEDLLRYAEALRGGAIVSQETLDLMRTPKSELGASRYGYGMVIGAGPGYPRYWGHGGDFEGVDADLMVFGDSGYTLVLLANQEAVNPPIIRLVQRLLAARGIP